MAREHREDSRSKFLVTVQSAAKAMKINISKRLCKLEIAAGLIETAEDRRDRELGQLLLKRMAVQRAQQGLPPLKVSQEILSRLTLKDILYRLHAKDRARVFAEKQELQCSASKYRLAHRKLASDNGC